MSRNVERFRGGLVFKAHRLLYQSTLGSRVMKRKKFRVEGRAWGSVSTHRDGSQLVWGELALGLRV